MPGTELNILHYFLTLKTTIKIKYEYYHHFVEMVSGLLTGHDNSVVKPGLSLLELTIKTGYL